MKLVRKLLTVVFFLAPLLPATASADDFDASPRITGTVDRLIEINPQRVIENVDPDTVGLPKTFVIDLQKRTMRGTPDSLVRRVAAVDRITRTPKTLDLQGGEEGIAGPGTVFGWNLAIDTATGKAVLSATGSGIAYVAYGTCSPSTAAREAGAVGAPKK